jgi:hypothetical protein
MTYKIQIDDLVRDATAKEIAEIEAGIQFEANRLAAQATEAEAKATAKVALLKKLGITQAEAELLLA